MSHALVRTKHKGFEHRFAIFRCVCVFLCRALSESPRWLVAIGNFELAEKTIIHAAKLNGVSDKRACRLWSQAKDGIEKVRLKATGDIP